MQPEPTLIMITSDGMGRAEQPLPRTLITKYLSLLESQEPPPGAICLYTDGVKLAVEGSPVLDSLRKLEARGVRLVLCKTCLDFLGLTDRVRVGTIGGMTDILDAQMSAARVITL